MLSTLCAGNSYIDRQLLLSSYLISTITPYKVSLLILVSTYAYTMCKHMYKLQ